MEHLYVKFGDLSCINFEISHGKTNKQTNTHTNATENLNHVTTIGAGNKCNIISKLLTLQSKILIL